MIQGGNTALIYACSYGKVSVVEYLIQQRADTYFQNTVKNHFIIMCVYY